MALHTGMSRFNERIFDKGAPGFFCFTDAEIGLWGDFPPVTQDRLKFADFARVVTGNN